jgi:hypothetical protein
MNNDKQFFWIDKTGRGFKAVFDFASLPTDDSEENEDEQNLLEWAEDCEVGDEFNTRTERYTRIK